MRLESINPATGERIAQFDEMTPGEIDFAVRDVAEAYQSWRRTSFSERASYFRRLAALLRARKKRYARLMAEEMGKPVAAGEGECEKCAWVCEWYADNTEAYLAPEVIESDAAKSFVTYQPIGPVLALMPWNFPFWQILRCAAPTMMAGNTILLKHANNVCGVAIEMEQLFNEAKFPRNTFRNLWIDIPGVKGIIEDPRVAAVSLTGSTRAGQSVGSIAGGVLKKCVLELGGSDPFIILEDANIETAVEIGATSRLFCNGESCIAAKRFIVVEAVREKFTQAYLDRMRKVKMGDSLDPEVDLGPLARMDLRDTLHQQVTKSVEAGARCLIGGEVPEGPGTFYSATVLDNVGPGMPAYGEELFGPVTAIIAAADEADAIRIANDTSYGLGGTVITEDRAKGERIAVEEVESGACFVNSMVKSDPRLPFGGIKGSGFGRELGAYGPREFTNIKTVYIA